MKYRINMSVFTILGLVSLYTGLAMGLLTCELVMDKRHCLIDPNDLMNTLGNVLLLLASTAMLLSAIGFFLKKPRTRLLLSGALHCILISLVARWIVNHEQGNLANALSVLLIILIPAMLFLLVIHSTPLIAALDERTPNNRKDDTGE